MIVKTTNALPLIVLLVSGIGCDKPRADSSPETNVSSEELQRCVSPSDTFGSAEVDVHAATAEHRRLDATFSLNGDSSALKINLHEPTFAELEIDFETPGQITLPAPGRYNITGPRSDSGHGVVASMIRESNGAYWAHSGVSGSVILSEVSKGGICGGFDVTWRSGSDTDTTTLRTNGTFRAAPDPQMPLPPGVTRDGG